MPASKYFAHIYHVYTTTAAGVALPAGTYRVGAALGTYATVYAPGTNTQISDVSGDENYSFDDVDPTGSVSEGIFDGTFKASNGTNFIGVYQHPDGGSNNSNTGKLYLYTNNSYKKGLISGFSPSTTEQICFAAGTLIRTAGGDIAVEELRVGDLVVTASGERRPIRWLGHRNVDLRGHPRPHEARPIRIAAHAFAAGRPSRDLFVSPGHSICVDVVGEVLMPAVALVNGTTIQQIEIDRVSYWHVELDSHDILVANGLPTESYLEMGNRDFFSENDIVAFDISPDADPARRTHTDFCRPFRERGKLVDAVREQLRLRAEELGWRLETEDLGDLHLVADGRRIEPVRRGLTVCFALPPEANDVRLMSGTTRPCDVETKSEDDRALGVNLRAIVLVDGFARCEVALDDPRLCAGFYDIEGNGEISWRWTDGRARLPATLWAHCIAPTLLRLDLASSAPPRWIAPEVTTSAPREAVPALVA